MSDWLSGAFFLGKKPRPPCCLLEIVFFATVPAAPRAGELEGLCKHCLRLQEAVPEAWLVPPPHPHSEHRADEVCSPGEFRTASGNSHLLKAQPKDHLPLTLPKMAVPFSRSLGPPAKFSQVSERVGGNWTLFHHPGTNPRSPSGRDRCLRGSSRIKPVFCFALAAKL